MAAPAKACPILPRIRAGAAEVLAFRHPLAGLQLVKGTVEPGEAPADAAVREMWEEAGIRVRVVRPLGTHQALPGQAWALFLCAIDTPLPDGWVHRTEDDGGHDFRFFWQPLTGESLAQWGPPYAAVLARIAALAAGPGWESLTRR